MLRIEIESTAHAQEFVYLADGWAKGQAVPKILVADDNSNIQKMVTLILKDQGIEVTAVGNGEAAVRRLPDLMPDVVLADVFMPVRSGYEVCEYIKKDPRFLHIPVVLLLGAFDPLDETEAKRVGADGVLKKPFVPPDPLLTLIKGLLERTAPESLVPAAVPAAAEMTAVQARPATRMAPLPDSFQGEAEEAEFPALGREALDTIGAHAAAPSDAHTASTEESTEEESEDSVVTQHRDSALGEPAFWRPLEPQEESLSDTVVESAAPSWGANTESLPRRDEFEGVQEMESEEETAQAPQLETLDSMDSVPETLHVEEGKAPGLAATPEEWLEAELSRPPHAATELEPPSAGMQEVASPEHSEAAHAPANLIEFSAPSQTHTDPELATSVAPEALEAFEPLTPATPPHEESKSERAAPSPTAEPEELPSLEELEPAIEQLGAAKPSNLSAALNAPVAAAPAARPAEPELVEAVVGRVMAKLQPQVIEIITREVLRPIVEALVRREIDKP
jgi:CheY-like chemotaxis protein